MAIDLLNPSTVSYIAQLTEDAVVYDDEEEAQEVLKLLRENLPGQQSKMDGNPELFEQYRSAWIKCQFIWLHALNDEDFFDLIKDHLIDGLKLPEYNIIDKIGRRVQFMELQTEQVAFMEQLLILLKKSSLLLGDKNLKKGGRILLPTIQNWLEDYDFFPSKSAARSDFDEVNYISKGPNAEILSPEDKDVLLEIIKLYDSLRNRLAAYSTLKEADDNTFVGDNYALLFPGAIVVDDNGNMISETGEKGVVKPKAPITEKPKTPVQLPQQPKPSSAPVIIAKPPIVAPVAPVVPKPVAPVVVKPLDAKPIPPQPDNDVMAQIKKNLEANQFTAPPKPVNIQDILNERDVEKTRGGLVYDTPAQPIPKRVVQEPEQIEVPTVPVSPKSVPQNLPVVEPVPIPVATTNSREEEINKKIAALRERANKNQQ